MSIPDLHPELWSQIISYLVRRPPLACDPSPWEELHQQDLTAVLRLNSTFQAITAPYLYTHVTAESFPALVRGITTHPPSSPEAPPAPTLTPTSQSDKTHPSDTRGRFLSKTELLLHTQTLHIVNEGPQCKLYLTMDRLLSGKEGWVRVGETPEDFFTRIKTEAQQIVSELSSTLAIIAPLANLPHRGIMPNLNTVVLGRPDACAWGHIYDRSPAFGADFQKVVCQVQKAFTATIMACRPTAICDQVECGPYSLYSVPLPPDLVDLTYTAHLRKLSTEFAFFMGATNRIAAQPGLHFRPDDLAVHPHFLLEDGFNTLFFEYLVPEELARLWRDSDKPTRSRIKDTKIEFYGVCRRADGDGGIMESMTEEELTEEDREDPDFMDGFVYTQLLKEQESMLIEMLTENVLSAYPKRWTNRISIERWAATKFCDACGWWEMGLADLESAYRWSKYMSARV